MVGAERPAGLNSSLKRYFGHQRRQRTRSQDLFPDGKGSLVERFSLRVGRRIEAKLPRP
jgi:hypothetical protein